MKNNVRKFKICLFVKRRSDNASDTNENIKLCLESVADLCDKGFSAPKLKHIPKMSESNGKNRLKKLSYRAVEKVDYAPG